MMLTKLVPPNIQLLAGRVDRQGLTETDVEEGHIPGAVFSPLVPCTMVSGQAMFTSENNAFHGSPSFTLPPARGAGGRAVASCTARLGAGRSTGPRVTACSVSGRYPTIRLPHTRWCASRCTQVSRQVDAATLKYRGDDAVEEIPTNVSYCGSLCGQWLRTRSSFWLPTWSPECSPSTRGMEETYRQPFR